MYDGYRMRPRLHEVRDGVELLRVPLHPSHDSSGARRALTLSSFALSATAQVGWLRDVDVCLVYLTPATVGLAARTLRALRRRPVRPLRPGPVAGERHGQRVHREPAGRRGRPRRASTGSCGGLYRHASATVAIAPGMAPPPRERGVPADRSHVVHNWVDESVFRPVPPAADRDARGGRFWVMYAGGIGTVQGLDARGARPSPGSPTAQTIGLALVGDGVAVPGLREQAARLGVADRVRFLGAARWPRCPA